jgi:CBS domain-containing protein
MASHSLKFNDIYHDVAVSTIMTSPAITVNKTASLEEINSVFCLHELSGMPVVDSDNHFVGLLLRKDVIDSCGMV